MLAALSTASLGISASRGVDIMLDDSRRSAPAVAKKQRRTRLVANDFRPVRSKAAPGKRKAKSNRNIISKRVRRKHRRGA